MRGKGNNKNTWLMAISEFIVRDYKKVVGDDEHSLVSYTYYLAIRSIDGIKYSALAGIVVVFGLFLLKNYSAIFYSANDFLSKNESFIFIATALFLFFVSVLGYLTRISKTNLEAEVSSNIGVRADLKKGESSLSSLRRVRGRSLDAATSAVIREVVRDSFSNSRLTGVDNNRRERGIEFEQQYLRLVNRIIEEIKSVKSRNAFNLSIGVTVTVVAISILALPFLNGGYVQLLAAVGKDGWNGLLVYFVPRISLALFTELFAVFFLKLYATGLAEIKYYQNELTGIELKLIALHRSVLSGDSVAMRQILRVFSESDRNAILRKGETTVDLERSRIDKGELRDIAELLSKLVEKGG